MENTEDEEENAHDNGLKDESEGEKRPSKGQTEAVSEWDMYRDGNETHKSGNERVESEADKLKERRNENKINKSETEAIATLSEAGRSDNGEEAEGDEGAEKRQRRRRWKRTKRDYAAASLHGKTQGNCAEEFPLCPVSLLKLLADS